MGQGRSFCWNCGRFVETLVDHDVHCKHYPRHEQPNPAAQHTAQHPVVPPPAEPGEGQEPPLSKQRRVRTCLTVWVAVLCSLGLLGIIVAIAFASQISGTLRPADRDSLATLAAACAGVGAGLLVPGIVLAIVWCSAFCCCKKRWVCACCGR